MRLLVVRHAEAVAVGDGGVSRDFDRHLTPKGLEQARKLAESLAARGVALDAVVSSPLVRAVQTAGPLLQLVSGRPTEPTVCDHLSTEDFRPKKVTKFLNELGLKTVAIVGHNPDLSGYAGWLIGADETSIELEKATAALFTFPRGVEKGEGVLHWLVTPEWFVGGTTGDGADAAVNGTAASI